MPPIVTTISATSVHMALPFAVITGLPEDGQRCPLGLGLVVEDKPTEFSCIFECN